MKRLVEKIDLQDRFKGDLIDEVIVNELINEDTMVLTFITLDNLKKVEQFIKDNFKFLKR